MEMEQEDQSDMQDEEMKNEQDEIEESTEVLAEDIEAMQSELERLRTDVEDTHERYLRTLADFDNFRRRQREETSRLTGVAREELICKLLPIMDNFERTLRASEEQHSYESLVEGVSLTLRQLNDMLRSQGVEPIEAKGEEFNPELHEAVMRVESDEYPDNTVVDELEKGYTLNGKVLRPARVRVAMSD